MALPWPPCRRPWRGGHKNIFPSNSSVKNKKRSSLQNMRKILQIQVWRQNMVFVEKSAKKRFLPTNTGLMISILGDSDTELHSSGTAPVTIFGAQFSLGDAHFLFVGAEAVIWAGGHGHEKPPVTPGLVLLKCIDQRRGSGHETSNSRAIIVIFWKKNRHFNAIGNKFLTFSESFERT